MGGLQRPDGIIRFADFELDLAAGELRKQGAKLRLQEQPFQVLHILLQCPGRMVSREELQQKIWPSDTFVDFDHGLYNAIKRLREALGDNAEKPQYIETVPRRGYRFIGKKGPATLASPSRLESLLILPLENLSRDPEQEYFADGLTEAIISELAKISGLRVVSRMTAMFYKNVRRPLPDIARERGVDAVIEGSVVRSGDRVRVSIQLIDGRTDAHVWAEVYDRDLREVLELYSELAGAVARQVCRKSDRLQMFANKTSRPAPETAPRSVDPVAYEAYLRGRYHWNKRSPVGVKKGAEYFQQAIDKDPNYAAAYAGLADSAGLAGFWAFVHPQDGCRKAKFAARRSLDIEETGEAHASMGWAILHYDFDYLGAEKEFQRAIELNSGYATAHQWYGHCLGYMGRTEASITQTKQALQIDPLSPIVHASCAGAFGFARQLDRAIDICHAGLELDPRFAPLHWVLAHSLQAKGMFDEAINERQKAVDLSPGVPVFIGELGGTYAAAGERKKALAVLDELMEFSKERYVMAYWIALIHAGLKERDEAFDWLEKAYQERSAHLAFLKVDLRLEFLHSDQRFHDLLRRMNFPARA